MHMVHIKQEYLSNQTAAETDESGYAVIGVFFKTSWHYHRTLGKVSKMVKKISKSWEINENFETEDKDTTLEETLTSSVQVQPFPRGELDLLRKV